MCPKGGTVMIMGLLVYTAGTALCLCPILWLFDFNELAGFSWMVFNLTGLLALLWPFVHVIVGPIITPMSLTVFAIIVGIKLICQKLS